MLRLLLTALTLAACAESLTGYNCTDAYLEQLPHMGHTISLVRARREPQCDDLPNDFEVVVLHV